MTPYDVIVIGSGPAGCSAAVTCVKNGLDVLMVTDATDRQHDAPDSMADALESIHPGVSSLLKKIGIAGAEVPAIRASYSGIYAGDNYTPLGEDEEGVWQGMHIDRSVFDHQLLHQAGDAGVKMIVNEKVENFIAENNKVTGISTSTRDLFGGYIIDATGKKGLAGRKLNFKRKYYSPPLLCSTGMSGCSETFPLDRHAAHFIAAGKGWTWLAPHPPEYCAWTRLSMSGDKSTAPPNELHAYPVFGKIKFANMRWRLFRPLCTEGLLLCGDAAGILDPAAGQGIFNALLSGKIAAEAIVTCLQEPAYASFHLARYDHWFVDQFELKVQQLRQYYQDHGIHIFH
ncbi:MAG: NAD(P)/FAD-dependent oxidoreductase [Saprospiraceae bacterium]